MAKKIKPPRDKEAEKKAEEAEKANAGEAAAAKEAAEAEKAAAAVQDEFQARGFELVEWVHHHPQVVLGFIAVVILSGLGFGIYTVNEKSKNTAASVAYAKAQKIWEAPVGEDPDPADDVAAFKDAAERSKAAKAAFEKVIADHKGTGAATLASLSIGNANLKAGDLDGAIAAYETFLAATPATDPLRFAGYAGLASAKDGKGDSAGAIKALEDQVALADKTDEDAALFALGTLYTNSGDKEKARARFEKLSNDFPESSFKARSDEQIVLLGGTLSKDEKKDDAKDAKKDSKKDGK